jgi:hypothetical protein
MRAGLRSGNEASTAAAADDIEKAIDHLESGFDKGLVHWALLKDESDFEILHAHPRFQKLIARQK